MVASMILYFHPSIGDMLQFDEHIFEMGWFNHHQLLLESLENVTKNPSMPIV